jgi:hypothetical protein
MMFYLCYLLSLLALALLSVPLLLSLFSCSLPIFVLRCYPLTLIYHALSFILVSSLISHELFYYLVSHYLNEIISPYLPRSFSFLSLLLLSYLCRNNTPSYISCHLRVLVNSLSFTQLSYHHHYLLFILYYISTPVISRSPCWFSLSSACGIYCLVFPFSLLL